MCGGGVGSANNKDNDEEKGSGNSFKETLANIFTPGDGMSYVDGRLTENNNSRDQQFYDTSNKSDDGPGYTTIYKNGKKTQIRKDANDRYKGRLLSGVMGAMSGGIPGILGSLATNELTRGAAGQGIMNMGETAVDAASGLKGLLATPEFDTPEEKAAYEQNRSDQLAAHYASIPGAGGDGNSGVAPTAVAPTVTLPGNNMPPPSNMSVAANQAFQPIPNPDYDPNDPMSQKFLSNPTYAQLLAYQQSQVPGMAEGGEVGGNEKTAISDAISAVKGQMPEEQAAIALGMFVQNYGEEALKNLIERVQSGEFDDTVDRFANGEAGEVVGPGDGSGVDDKVPASLEGQQDVLLADGEFVLRKKTADALEKKYGGGFLDTVNEAEDNAPRTMQEYMARA